jgi:sec-independent protein translocase protein TatA
MELIIILVIVLLIFGVGKLPQVGKSIGQALKGFKEGSSGESEKKDETSAVATPETPKPAEETKAQAAAKVETPEKPKTDTAAKT